MRRIYLCLLCLIFWGVLQAADDAARFFRQYTEKEGLSDRRVQCLWRDRQGWLWVGTAYGLNRFDGHTFKSFLPDADQPRHFISNESIHAIAEDSRNRLWIATANGLNCYEPRTGIFQVWKNTGRDNGSLPNSWLNHLWIDAQDRVWLACDNRDLACFDPKTNRFSTYPWKAFATQASPQTATKDYRSIEKIEPKSKSEIWLRSNIGLYSFDLVHKQFSHHVPITQPIPNLAVPLPKGISTEIALRDANGSWWFGGTEGLWRYEAHAALFRYFEAAGTAAVSPGEPHPPFLFLDRRNAPQRLVLNVYQHILSIFEEEKLLKKISLPGHYAALLYEDQRGVLWVAGGNQLYTLEPQTWRLLPFPIPAGVLKNNQPSVFRTMTEDSQGRLWFGNDHEGLLIYDPQKKIWTKPSEQQGFLSQAIWSLQADPQRKCVWIGTEDYGLFRYDERKQVFSLYEHDDEHPRTSIGAYMIRDIKMDQQGHVWAATDPGGISRFEDSLKGELSFFTLGVKDGLASNRALGLAIDHAGRIWVSTIQGLSCLDFNTKRFRKFGNNDGLPSEPLSGPIIAAHQGRLVFGTATGIYSFHPDSLLHYPQDSRVLLTQFSIFDRSLSDSINLNYTPNLNLSWRDNFFSFEFSSANFFSPEKNEYSYRLIGFDKDWIYPGKQGRGSYTNVPAGNYQLVIRSGREGVWNRAGYHLDISITPPFWQTWPFIALTTLLLGALVYALYQYRINQIRKEEQTKAEFQRRLAAVEMSALRAQMNPHFVFNCLNSINRYILVNEPEAAAEYLTKFARLIRLILDNSRTDLVPLDRELDALNLYIEMEAMRFAQKFTYEIEVAPNVHPGNHEIPPLLIQPYVENAIWHGLMHKKENGRLIIKVFKTGGCLCISIEDNGIGRKAAAALHSKSAQRQKSLGMQVTAERLAMIQELYGVKAQGQIEDLYTDGEAEFSAGTRVTISIQMNDDHVEHLSH